MLRVFRHYVDLPAIGLAACEMGILFALVYAITLYVGVTGYDVGAERAFTTAGLMSMVAITVMSSVGLYNREHFVHMTDVISRAIVVFPLALIACILVLAVYSWVLHGRTLAGFYIISAAGLLSFFPLLMGLRQLFIRVVDNYGAFKRRVLVIGSGARAAKIDRLSRELKDRTYTVVGFVRLGAAHAQADADVRRDKRRNHQRRADFWIEPTELADFCESKRVDELVVAPTERRGLPVHELLACKLRGTQITEYATFWERESGQIDLDEISPSWLVFSDGFQMGNVRAVLKRAFDIVVSALLLVITTPLTIPTAILIRLESPGPIFYRQERVGLNQKSFSILKFRSMRQDAEKNGPQWAAKNDARVTRVGAFIRKVRIDEIPQALNVLKGDMSFVGPRPERPVFVDALAKTIPYYNDRHVVKPGITGWAQINYPYGATEEDAKMKLSYDLYYIKNGSLFLDVIVMLQTVKVLLWNQGAH